MDRVSKGTCKEEVGIVKAPGGRNRLRWPNYKKKDAGHW